MTTVGKRIFEARIALGMSLRDVERFIRNQNSPERVSSGHLSLIEHGHVSSPTPPTLKVLAAALSLDYMSLMVDAGYIDANPAINTVAPTGLLDGLTPEQTGIIRTIIQSWRESNDN